GDRREDLGERGPQDDEAEDQPDVVRFPHRADRVVDECARLRPALRPARDQVPEAGPEVRATEEGVRGHADEQDHRDEVGFAHDAPAPTGSSSGGGATGPRGPYGTSVSSTSAARKRRLIARSTFTSTTPTTR